MTPQARSVKTGLRKQKIAGNGHPTSQNYGGGLSAILTTFCVRGGLLPMLLTTIDKSYMEGLLVRNRDSYPEHSSITALYS